MTVLNIFILSFALGAPPNKCLPGDGPTGFKCFETMTEILDTTQSLYIFDDASIKKINQLCGNFQKCSNSLNCEAPYSITTRHVNYFCDGVNYLSTVFKHCDGKLTARNSTCLQNWNPFPVEVHDREETKHLKKDACQNFFGKDNCMEKEIKKMCGTEKLIQFKKYFLALNKIIKQCYS